MARTHSSPYESSVERVCPVCGTTFRTYAAWIRRGGGKTCSRSCGNKAKPRRAVEERLWEKVDRSGGPEACWEFNGARHTFGYGKIGIAGSGPRDAHRLVWELTHGPIPAGMEVCHQCDNPPCCNPDHLFLGSRQDNVQDATHKGRTTIGERNPMAKLTWEDVAEIRARHAAGESRSEIAERFGVTRGTVWLIYSGRTWTREDAA